MTALRLLPPPPLGEVPPLDADAEAVLEAVADGGGHVLVVGAAGTGKTTLAVQVAARAVTEQAHTPEKLLVVAPTRTAAADLRDRVTLAMSRPTGTPVVRTAASTGFAILSAQARSLEQPPPVLLTGAEQDVELRTLLAGHREGRGAAVTWEGVVPPAATALPGFRDELRNLLMRAAEAGKSPEELAALGRETERPEWVMAAQVYREYLDVMTFRSMHADQGERFDPARVVADAADALRRWDDVAEGPQPSWDLVVVDDYQDATAATTDMLRALADDGARLVLLGNADQTVHGFRGAVPTALDDATRARAQGGLGAARFELGTGHRQRGALADVTSAVVEHIGVMGHGSASRARATADGVPTTGAAGSSDTMLPRSGQGDDVAVTVVTAPHSYAQSRAIATLLRRARHGLDAPPVPWGSMAVIARSTAQLRSLRSDLMAADIPCETLGDGTALHEEPAVAPLLTMLRVALGQDWSVDSVAAVLSSRLVGLDPLALRRVRRALVREEREGGGERGSTELLIEAMGAPERWASLPGREAAVAARAASAVAAGREAARKPGASPGTVLWAMWTSLGVADQWREAAMAGSARDDADLDAVIALMRAAQSFTERLPHASPGQFVYYLESQDFAADSLGARAQSRDVVTFTTPTSAAGREWDVVAIAGLEEGVWPNLRLRDSVLGAGHLADILAGRAAATPVSDARRVETAHAARRAVLDDETRAFAVAVSRARRQLIASCVDGDESRPSRYLSWIEAAARVERMRDSSVAGVSDLREAVARLRIEGANAVEERQQDYASMVARLAELHAAGAHPRHWHGVPLPSTDAPLWAEDEPVRVSPSRVDLIETCALKWALESAGGTPESSDKQLLGTLVHEIAAAHPRGSEAELLAALDARWHEIGGLDTWAERVQRARAEEMVGRLAHYLAEHVDVDVAVEEAFSVQVGRAVLAGSADRVESRDGVGTVVDLKTGSPIPMAEVPEHGQLAMYQLAAHHGAFDGVDDVAGAQLVFLGSGVKPAVRVQPSIDVEAQRSRLAAVVDTMAAATFEATPNDMCERCPVRRSCPAMPMGRQVSDA